MAKEKLVVSPGLNVAGRATSALGGLFQAAGQVRSAAIDERSEVIDSLDRPIYVMETRSGSGDTVHRISISLLTVLVFWALWRVYDRGVFTQLIDLVGNDGPASRLKAGDAPSGAHNYYAQAGWQPGEILFKLAEAAGLM